MQRIGFLGIVTVIGLLAVASAGPRGGWHHVSASALRQEEAFEAGGIGLSRGEWEERHGSGEAGQGSQYYEGGAYDVNFLTVSGETEQLIAFVRRVWDEEGGSGATIEEAEAEIVALLPPDARLAETSTTRLGPAVPFVESLTILLYRSDWLAERVAGHWTGTLNGSIVVTYVTDWIQSGQQMEPHVPWVNLSLGSQPPDALPEFLLGEWTGTGTQVDPDKPDAPPIEWPLTLTLSGGSRDDVVGTVVYPTLGCSSELVLVNGTATALELTERIVAGPCIDGVFQLSLVGEDLSFAWRAAEGGSLASGLLVRSD